MRDYSKLFGLTGVWGVPLIVKTGKIVKGASDERALPVDGEEISQHPAGIDPCDPFRLIVNDEELSQHSINRICDLFLKTRKWRNEMSNLENDLNEIFSGMEMDKEKSALVKAALLKIEEAVSLSALREKLKTLYEYEKNYLELIKAYKEEIKFAASLQEDLRKERTKFFSEALKEVSVTLKESQVEPGVAAGWVKELVASYTKSLDLSSGLVDEQTIETVGEMRKSAKQEERKVKERNGQSE